MITSDYILSIIPEMSEFNSLDPASHVYYAQGYDGVFALFDNIRSISYPAIVIEDRSSGNIVIDAGPVDTYTISLWIMLQDVEKEQSALFVDAFKVVKKLTTLLIRDADTLPGFDWTRIPYFKRMANKACGYEMMLTFNEDIDLS